MRVAVAMCTFNGARFLRQQLASIVEQTRLPDELVICDDASTDNTVEFLQRFADSAPFPVRVIANRENQGSTKNFEKAISSCQADIIVLSDQDDIWQPYRLQKTCDAFEAEESLGLVFGDADIINQDSSPVGMRLWDTVRFGRMQKSLIQQGRYTQALLKRTVVTGATMAFRSRYLDVVLPIPPIWVHDAWIALIISFFAPIKALETPLIRYRKHATQQIGPGVGEHSMVHRIRESLSGGESPLGQQAIEYQAAYERLAPWAQSKNQKEVLACLREKIRHFSSRYQLPEPRIYRIPPILRELVSRRYTLYSRGIQSAIKDFIVYGRG
jgi:glycosyltransferase involved in cell wall biosynthesis